MKVIQFTGINRPTMPVNSDDYFNNKEEYDNGFFDVDPVDAFAGFVPQDKSLGNLKKTQSYIRRRFALGK